MQQPVMEEGAAYEPSISYDDLFPALPESAPSNQSSNTIGQWSNNKMRVGSSTITQVFRVPYEERRLDGQKFGEGESNHICGNIMRETGAHIEISHAKDQSLTFLITGKQNEVLEARRKILTHFQTQASKQISIPKEHHRWILGKKGDRLRDLEKNTATKISVPPMNENSDVITITGTKEGIEKAEHEIRVTSDQQSKKASERLDIPKHFHPFITGPYNSNLNSLIAETGARINVPPPSVMKDEIFIAGEKEGVLAAKAKIEEIYRQIEKKSTTVSVEVSKSQHKYIIGPKGATIQDILKTTGVSVEMPQSDSTLGTITLRGPHDKLGLALGVVYEKANSVRSSDIDAPYWLHKYIIGRGGATIKEITQNLPKVHVEFTDKIDKIKIEGPPEEVEKAQEEIEKMTRDLVGRMTFCEMNVDPKLFKHIIGKNGANINKLKDEFKVLINIDKSGLVRIEGNKEDVASTKTELEQRIFKLENEKEKDVIIEQRHYRNIIGTKGDNIKEIRDKFNQVQIYFPGPGDRNDIVKVRGPKEDVDKCARYLEKLVKELGESSYQIEVPIFKQFHKFIIGKGGANIRKIREETNTKIDLPAEGDKNDVITITGKKENVEEARDKIRKIQDELESIVSEEITIPPKFYNSLIGAKGKLIHSIMEDCGGVAIKFPTADSKSDKVTIRGPKEDVDRAKQQLLDLANERQLASYSVEVRAKAQHHKFLIGKNGANIKKIRDSTGARIVFPSNSDDDREVITIIGKKEAVEEAKAALEATIKDIDNIVESEMEVEPRHHKHFVARRGEVLHRIADDCGGVTISFPRSGVESNRVVLKGSKECIEAAKFRINEIISDLESMVTIECIIPQKHHRTVMGAKGHKVQGITSDFDVQIKFPERDNQEEYINYEQVNGDINEETVRQCDVIKITGKESNCYDAKQALLDLVPITISVDVPFDLHRSIIGQRGRDVKDLMDRFDVHIVLSPPDVRENIIKITGTVSNVERAKEALLERVQELELERKDRELRSYALQIEVNPEYHPKIIGKKGAIITKIRKDHDVQINFPKKGDPDEHIITITGYEENTYRAREDIMKIVNELNDLVKEEISIDSRVHSRLIGARGRNIRKIMEDYNVDIKFPRSDDPDPNLVIISGQEENVIEAKDHLLNLGEEYMQDFDEQQTRERQHTLNIHFESPTSQNTNSRGREFVVQGGPWEQRAPNTSSVTEFPSFGRNVQEPQSAPSPVGGAWGARR
ncbi:satellite-binding protein 1 Dp1 [Leptinotarsa decemlineata]|uniref:satellite-binding protein 1 Dp1 n=1 Tax=Leptinotarsa decemlineata TaxID=7539 RepID=UPI000C2548E5|nr:vigilin isoform X1 [Leptinotarsa decemlineata]